jgi:serine/threonine protein kinase/tetratricopeptide (TPR) repeat protein
MDSDRWQRIQLLFDEALAQPDEARRAFLTSVCGDDVELRDEVLSLLAAHEPGDEVRELPTEWFGALVEPKVSAGFTVGTLVAGRYLIKSLLGRGGMGEVYEAWDEELSIPVALKTLLLAGRTDEARRRLKMEGFLARSVWHPNVCRLYDLGRHGEGPSATWFLTMELLLGETLSKRLEREGRLPLAQAQQFAKHMAEGVGAAHQAGVVHRDFKPGNVILVGKDGGERAVVTDFGIARAVSAGAADEEDLAGGYHPIIGTPAYMAPEQLRGDEVGPAADIYALGIVLYEMVTGTLPFADGSAIEIAKHRLYEDVPSPRTILPELDERWETVILRCLAREPSRRFQRAEEVAKALEGRTLAETAEVSVLKVRARHTLPVERDDFVGREGDLKTLERNFAGNSRLVTLVGAGGMGKTRLAVRYGWRNLADWPGGLWFCDLTEARDVNAMASIVARSLGIQLGRGDPLDQIGHAIAGRGRCLVLMDNFEQVAGGAAETVGQWLERAGEARFLVTSREKLNIGSRETVQAVESLPVEMGMELFATRARRLRPGLELLASDAEAAREIVRLVDGMPLAIELAGARMRVMNAPEIVARMQARFRLLTGGGTARHETLEVAIDGSWELLHAWERAAWAQCSAFDGGFTLDAAEGVVDLSVWPDAPWVVDVIQSLVDKSLLRTWVPEIQPGGGEPEARFGMYASLQEYARLKLVGGAAMPGASGVAVSRAAEERHGKWFAQYGAAEAITALDHSGGYQRRKVERELGNLMTGCRRALVHGDSATAVELFMALWSVLGQRGPFAAALELGREVLEAPLALRDRASALKVLGHVEMFSGRMEEARLHFEAALAIHRELGERFQECAVLDNLSATLLTQGQLVEARAHSEAALLISREIGARRAEGGIHGLLGNLCRQEGRMEDARAHHEAALAIHREVDNRRLEGVALSNLGILHYDHGRLDEAQAHFEGALAIHREIGNRNSEGIVLGNLGSLSHDRGRLEAARSYFEAALALHREVGHRRFEGAALGDLGNLHRAMGEMAAARSNQESALVIHREVGARRLEGVCLGDLGDLNHDEGRFDDARTCYEAALLIHREVRDRRSEGIAHVRLGKLLLQAGVINEARQELTTGEAIIREVGDPIELGKLLCARGELEAGIGEEAAARATLGEVEAIAGRLQSGPDSELGRRVAKLRLRLLHGTAKRTH